jgi:hypothetical protein
MKFRTEPLGPQIGPGKIRKYSRYLGDWRRGKFIVQVLSYKYSDVYFCKIVGVPDNFNICHFTIYELEKWAVGKQLDISDCYLKRRLFN